MIWNISWAIRKWIGVIKISILICVNTYTPPPQPSHWQKKYVSHCKSLHVLMPFTLRYTHLRGWSSSRGLLSPRQSGLDVYADLAWQQQILLRTPSSYCLCPARHGSLTHRSTAWRQIDCEHPNCPSWMGVWQSSDRQVELIFQARCLFSTAIWPVARLRWASCSLELKSPLPTQTPSPSATQLILGTARNNWQWQNNMGECFPPMFLKLFPTWQWVMKVSNWKNKK